METIEQKNKLIAEFMGIEHTLNDSKTNKPFSINFLYHLSWDAIMPVVEKIERLGFTVEKNFQRIDGDWQCLITKGNHILLQEFDKQSIQAMHYVVSEFIKWYNKQKF